MKPIKFSQVNMELSKPLTMTNEQCQSLPVFAGDDHEGYSVFISCFQLDSDELLRIMETGKVWLRVHSDRHPPVSLDVEIHGRENENYRY